MDDRVLFLEIFFLAEFPVSLLKAGVIPDVAKAVFAMPVALDKLASVMPPPSALQIFNTCDKIKVVAKLNPKKGAIP